MLDFKGRVKMKNKGGKPRNSPVLLVQVLGMG
jgi:hypothetical protein